MLDVNIAAVESTINALEVHGLDPYPDQGLDGFQRYVALAILARNIQQLGVRLKKKKVPVATRRKKSRLTTTVAAASCYPSGRFKGTAVSTKAGAGRFGRVEPKNPLTHIGPAGKQRILFLPFGRMLQNR